MANNPSHLPKRARKKAASKAAYEAKISKFAKIILEQGGMCWFCGEKMGADCTKEHLLAQALGGSNARENLRAAHGDCNGAAGHLPVSDKLRLRAVGHEEGRAAMLMFARQLRRADARAAFSGDAAATEPEPAKVTFGRKVRGPQGDVLDGNAPTIHVPGKKPKKPKQYRLTTLPDGRVVLVVGRKLYGVQPPEPTEP